MLPLFFQHYDPWVDRYFIYDNHSDDRTLEILHKHPKVQVQSFPMEVPDSYVLSAQIHHNQIWKKCRARADWVCITAIDEFLYHHDMATYLSECAEAGITAIPAIGFQMISDVLPIHNQPLIQQVRRGSPWSQMNKMSLFNPDKIANTGFAPGRHCAEPTGEVIYPLHDEMLNLHFKYLDFEVTFQRHQALGDQLRVGDKQNNFGHKYHWTRAQLMGDWQNILSLSWKDVIGSHPNKFEGIERWWRPVK